MSVEIEGLDEVMSMFEDMNISEEDERRALNNSTKGLEKGLESATPKWKTKKLSKIKKSTKREGLGYTRTLSLGAFWDIFQEFGTSQQKHHVGFFERTVRQHENKVIDTLVKELIDRKIK